MRTPIGHLIAAQQAVVQGTQDMGLKGVELATRFFDLQTQAVQGMLAAGSDTAHGGLPDPLAVARGGGEHLQRLAQLGWQAHAEMTEVGSRLVGDLQSVAAEALAAAMGAVAETPPPTRGGGRKGRAAAGD